MDLLARSIAGPARGSLFGPGRAQPEVRVRSSRIKPLLPRKRKQITRRAVCQVPHFYGWAKETPEAPCESFREWQRTQTQSSAKARLDRSLRQRMDGWFCVSQEPCREALRATRHCRDFRSSRSSERADEVFFCLTETYHGCRITRMSF